MTEERGRAGAATGGRAAAPEAPPEGAPEKAAAPAVAPKGGGWKRFLLILAFLAPALVALGALVVYPIFFTLLRSTYDRANETFVGFQNYQRMFDSPGTLTAIRNNAFWVVVVPPVVTGIGLIFAVLTERIRWATAFKVAVFMPLAISFLSAGVIWRLVYDIDPERGLGNALIQGAVHTVRSPGAYSGARPSDEALMQPEGRAFVTSRSLSPGDSVEIGLVGIPPDQIPEEAQSAIPAPQPGPDAIGGTVWLDFTPGGGGERGAIDPAERGLPGTAVEAVADGRVVSSASTGPDGAFLIEGLEQGQYEIRLAAQNFRQPWGGIAWVGPGLVTPSVMAVYVWIYVGFAMVIIGAGLAAIPRDVLEAARVDGANEWQVFRRVTVPLLAPVLGVVFVTLMISVLKVFDLIIVVPPFSTQPDATVLAVEMWRASFGGARDQGLGSALAVFLFVLVVPAMLFNIRRFRREA